MLSYCLPAFGYCLTSQAKQNAMLDFHCIFCPLVVSSRLCIHIETQKLSRCRQLSGDWSDGETKYYEHSTNENSWVLLLSSQRSLGKLYSNIWVFFGSETASKLIKFRPLFLWGKCANFLKRFLVSE